MKKNFTPGPWLKDLSKRNSLGLPQTIIFVNPVGKVKNGVCNVFGKTMEQCEANARLIASAPDMLSALRNCRDFFVNNNITGSYLNMVEETIAKALGETSNQNQPS